MIQFTRHPNLTNTTNMYVTRPLSLYTKSQYTASELPPQRPPLPAPEGPSSGVLVIQDEEAIAEATYCWGFCTRSELYALPLPQNKMLKVVHTTRTYTGEGPQTSTDRDDVYFIPVIDQPLSANRYYVILGSGKRQGEAYRCSKEGDVTICCFCCRLVHDLKPGPFDYRDVYQQIELSSDGKRIHAEAVASDGHPPLFLRRSGYHIHTSARYDHNLEEALGINKSLRARLPDLDFPLSAKNSPAIVVGKWYSPFMFIKEGDRVKDQMKKSTYYEMTLQQFWEEIYTCDNHGEGKQNNVDVSVGVRTELALLNGDEVVEDDKQVIDGVIWFAGVNSKSRGLGLCLPIWERMKWEEERGGWIGSKNLVERTDEFGGLHGWRKFACYVLVERFVLKRMDGSIALTYDFKHTNKVQSRWE